MTPIEPQDKMTTNEIIVVITIIIICLLLIGGFLYFRKIDISKSLINFKKIGLVKKDEVIGAFKKQIANIVVENKQSLKVSIFFNTNEYMLSQEDIKDLNKIVTVSKQYPKAPIIINGFADTTGKELNNISLSIKRAQSVKNYLFSCGINNITSTGYGSNYLSERQVDITINY